MPTAYIGSDEWYPCYYLTDREMFGEAREVPEQTLGRWKSIQAAWDTAQEEMAAVDNGEPAPDYPDREAALVEAAKGWRADGATREHLARIAKRGVGCNCAAHALAAALKAYEP